MPAGPPKAGADATDAFAPEVHAMLEFELREKGNACLSNMRAQNAAKSAREVWCHAVWKYSATFVEAPGGNEKYVKITNTVYANDDTRPPTVGVTTDRVVTYVYQITYDKTGLPDSAAAKDWISVAGQAGYAPASLVTIAAVQWIDPNAGVSGITEQNIRKVDGANP